MNPFSLIFSGISTLFGWLTDRVKARHDLKLAEIEAKRQMVLSKEIATSEWEMAQLLDKDKVLRWAAFLLFASPLIANFISPDLGHRVQAAWNCLPQWQGNALSAMCLAVFGLKKIPQLVGSTVGAVIEATKKFQLPNQGGK